MRNPPDDHAVAVWIWPRALPLAGIFGSAWDGTEVRARFLTLTGQWHARHPAPSAGGDKAGPRPGQWMWHPPAHRIYDCHTYEAGDDWLEVAIRMEAIDFYPDHCRLGASLSIACRCETAHAGHHTIVETSWRTGGPAGALDALTAVLRYTDQWIANSQQPAGWRRHAGLG